MKFAVSKREQRAILLVGLLTVIIGWVYIAYVLGPLKREAANLKQQLQTTRAKMAELESATTNEGALRQQYLQWDEKVKALRDLLPAQEKLPAIIERLSDLASQAQVKIQTIFPQRSAAEEQEELKVGRPPATKPAAPAPVLPTVYEEVLIQIDALAGYHQLGTFLSLIESAKNPMRVWNLRIAQNPKDPKRHYIKLLLKVYFATNSASQNVLRSETQP